MDHGGAGDLGGGDHREPGHRPRLPLHHDEVATGPALELVDLARRRVPRGRVLLPAAVTQRISSGNRTVTLAACARNQGDPSVPWPHDPCPYGGSSHLRVECGHERFSGAVRRPSGRRAAGPHPLGRHGRAAPTPASLAASCSTASRPRCAGPTATPSGSSRGRCEASPPGCRATTRSRPSGRSTGSPGWSRRCSPSSPPPSAPLLAGTTWRCSVAGPARRLRPAAGHLPRRRRGPGPRRPRHGLRRRRPARPGPAGRCSARRSRPDAACGRRGVPPELVTSLHSAGEKDLRGKAPYDRLVDTRTGDHPGTSPPGHLPDLPGGLRRRRRHAQLHGLRAVRAALPRSARLPRAEAAALTAARRRPRGRSLLGHRP